MSRLAPSLVLAALASAPRLLWAETPPGRVAILVSGPGAADVAKSIKASLPPGPEVLDAPDTAAVNTALGPTTRLKLPLDGRETALLTKVGAAQHVDAFVIVTVQPVPRARRITLEVFDLSHAPPYAPHTLRLGARAAPSDAAKLSMFTRVVSPLKAAVPPVAEAPPPPPPPPVPAAPSPPSPQPTTPRVLPAPERPAGDPAYSLASVEAGFDLATRTFTYHQGLSPNLRPYSGALAPAVAIDAQVYPLANTQSYVLQNIGLKGDFHSAFGLSTRGDFPSSVQTAWSSFDILLRYRFPLGTDKPPVLGVFFGYAREEFVFAIPVASYPSAAYPALAGGGDFRVAMGRSSLTASGDYLAVLSVVGVGQNFRVPSAAGVDASLRYGLAITPFLEAFAVTSWTRYFYVFEPKPGDTWVAGGAVDQMFHGQVGLRAIY